MTVTPPGAPDQHQTYVCVKENWTNLEWRHLAPFSERARTVSRKSAAAFIESWESAEVAVLCADAETWRYRDRARHAHHTDVRAQYPYHITRHTNSQRCVAAHRASKLHDTVSEKRTARFGGKEISITIPESKRRVRTRADWLSAWQCTIAATAFLFPHFKRDPWKHRDNIYKEFTAEVDLATHHQVILYDRAVRIIVGGGEEHLLTDLETFRSLYNAIITRVKHAVRRPVRGCANKARCAALCHLQYTIVITEARTGTENPAPVHGLNGMHTLALRTVAFPSPGLERSRAGSPCLYTPLALAAAPTFAVSHSYDAITPGPKFLA
ncbi:hypothetical protein HYPSUDRAFT_207078 [Hypholoma sublateritium FD-334 SS-4]|uniref:Uncharacterized protein n=1 Tax=Hypholoma sublateritium (strain FD-334 SS-4) TaxID=945553 RepID=A0A0D2LZM7_HYPSF|nr:hypothetical protein HYPSUDRAFT_207078 [Hypholoma sublateritium FD-334 SS-4]